MISLCILKEVLWMTFTNIFSQCLIVEETREQSQSRVWFDQRGGRVTVSVFSEVARADTPACLSKMICYPHASRFSTEATRYIDRARGSFVAMMKDHHEDFQVRASGFIINPRSLAKRNGYCVL